MKSVLNLACPDHPGNHGQCLLSHPDLRWRHPGPEHRRPHPVLPRQVLRLPACERDANGRIKRDSSQRRAFQRANPCPLTGKTSGACPGYVVDHIKPLKRGGADELGNMQ